MFLDSIVRQLLQETFEIWMRAVRRSIEDEHRGEESYEHIKTGITPEGLVGYDGSTKERNPDGSFRMVRRRVRFMDDLGNILLGAEDVAGQCVKGEIVKQGYLFTCIKCHKRVCMKHARFFNGDRDKPLCTVGWFPCYDKYKRIHDKNEELEHKKIITIREAELAEAITWRNRVVRQAEEEKKIYEKNKRLEHKRSYVIKEAEVAEAQTRRNRGVREAEEEKYKLEDLKSVETWLF